QRDAVPPAQRQQVAAMVETVTHSAHTSRITGCILRIASTQAGGTGLSVSRIMQALPHLVLRITRINAMLTCSLSSTSATLRITPGWSWWNTSSVGYSQRK